MFLLSGFGLGGCTVDGVAHYVDAVIRRGSLLTARGIDFSLLTFQEVL
jgi:hypothetical protein